MKNWRCPHLEKGLGSLSLLLLGITRKGPRHDPPINYRFLSCNNPLAQSYRNTVPVPRHWCQKRKYLQGKRGIEKTPFELPEFIAMTGIDKIRAAIEEADSQKKVTCMAAAFRLFFVLSFVHVIESVCSCSHCLLS